MRSDWKLSCLRPGCTELMLTACRKRCSKCTVACYCSKTCQMEHWPAHKTQCKRSRTVDDVLIVKLDSNCAPPLYRLHIVSFGLSVCRTRDQLDGLILEAERLAGMACPSAHNVLFSALVERGFMVQQAEPPTALLDFTRALGIVDAFPQSTCPNGADIMDVYASIAGLHLSLRNSRSATQVRLSNFWRFAAVALQDLAARAGACGGNPPAPQMLTTTVR
jgi:hypothetical protein